MEILNVEALSFQYPDDPREALSKVSFTVKEGEFVVLCGASGCGKTTLLRHLKQETAPEGTRSGSIRYKSQLLSELPAQLAAEEIGMVFQNPESQIVMDTVWHELAFAMENLGYTMPVMRKRLAEMAHFFGLEPLLYKSVHELSGGQKQLINLASVLLLQPKVLLLDEPCSQLDPVAAREFLQIVYRLNQEFSMTIIMSEHRLEDVIPIADRVMMLENGQIKYEGAARAVAEQIGLNGLPDDKAYLPAVTRLYLAAAASAPAADQMPVPLTVREGKQWLSQAFTGKLAKTASISNSSSERAADIIAACREITYKYEKDSPEVLNNLSLQVQSGEFLAILGGNGAGKSTLLKVLAGLLKPMRGKVITDKKLKIGYLAQNPLLYFSHDTVREELMHMARYASIADPERETERLLDLLQISDTIDSHPHDLSGGQQQRIALALVLLPKPQLLCIDEPTKGLDPIAKQRMAGLLLELQRAGTTIVMVTHDVEFAAQYATRCAILFDGMIASEGAPAFFFQNNYFYTTSINRVAREWLPDAITCEDVMAQWPNPVLGS